MGPPTHCRYPQDRVQKWVADLKLSPSSVAHAHTVLAGILDDAVADRRLVANPGQGVEASRKGPEGSQLPNGRPGLGSRSESSTPTSSHLLATTGLRWGDGRPAGARHRPWLRPHTRRALGVEGQFKTIIGTTKTHASRSVAVSSSVLKLLAPAMVGKSPDELLWSRPTGSRCASNHDALVQRRSQTMPGGRQEFP